MAASTVLGFTAIRRRDITAHRAWMVRAYALAVAADTQAFTQGIGEALIGTSQLSTVLSVSSRRTDDGTPRARPLRIPSRGPLRWSACSVGWQSSAKTTAQRPCAG